MKIVIELSPEYYNRLLKYANEASPVYSTLKNGVKIARSEGSQSEVIVILCDEEQAEMLRRVANHFCPQAVPEMERWIKMARLELPQARA